MSKKTMTLTNHANGRTAELSVHKGTAGPEVVDITRLYRDMGVFTFDPGFMATGSCRSSITYIDGDAGKLWYRGYPIEQLAEKSNFLEIAYLLLYGDLPARPKLEEFESIIRHHTMINETLRKFFSGFHYNAHPMAIMVGVVGSLSAFYHDSIDIHDPRHREISAHRMIAKMPTIAAASYKHNIGEPFIYPRNDLDYCANFLSMMFATPCEPFEPDPVAVKAVNLLFILVLDMLREIGDVSNIDKYILKAKDPNDPFRLMGFGHRVYKNHDPRATIIRKICHEVLENIADTNNPMFELALRLEQVALEDEYFVERKLYPNVDFYSGIIYQALNIPATMFTVMFAIARTVGWVAHWMEMMDDPEQRIGRPRQIYVGAPQRDYVPLDQR